MTRLTWICDAPDGSTLVLGEHDYPDGGKGAVFHVARSPELARSWARDLPAGRIPSNAEPDPEPAPDESSSDQTVPAPALLTSEPSPPPARSS